MDNNKRRFWRGMCTWGLLALSGVASSAEGVQDKIARYEVLASFERTSTGYDARGPLVLGMDGDFYGVATFGGQHDAGTLFRVSQRGKITVLHHFSYDDGRGALPIGSPLELGDGSWLGTTCDAGPRAGGGIYRLGADGAVSLLRWFDEGQPHAPACSYAPLMPAIDGRVYGTTIVGGRYGEGTVFSLMPDGSDLRVLHHFRGGATDGAGPTAGLIQASDGALYGTTARGGRLDFGAVFRLAPGRPLQVLHFMTQRGGTGPWGPLLQASDGRLYGINQTYGPNPFDADRGTVFRLDDRGRYAVVDAFGDTPDSPRLSSAGLVQDADGSLWSASSWGGAYFFGSLFRLRPDGTREVLHSFQGSDGASPAGAPTPGPNGWWYGTTSSGGAHGQGVVYRVKAGR